MANRRRGKSVVFDSLPSLMTTEDDSALLSRETGRLKANREALREIVMVLVGLVLVVWLFFGGGTTGAADKELRMGSRALLKSDTPYIFPAHFGAGSGTNPRDGVKKAPGDKQKGGVGNVDSGKGAKNKQNNAIYQYYGPDSPELVVLTVIDDNKHPRDYVEKIIENRLEYAQAHHYGLLIKFTSDLSKFIEESYNHQPTWGKVALSLEAQVSFPDAKWFWYLGDSALIMQPEKELLNGLLAPNRLEQLSLKQIPVMRYENTHIRTYRNNRIQDVSYVLCQNSESVNTDSFLFKNNVASRIWLEMWAEPLYRTFDRFINEEDALGHMMQWHTQFLVRSVVIEPRSIGSLVVKDTDFDEVWQEVEYVPGDFVAIIDCDFATESCKHEFHKKWTERGRVAPSNQASLRENVLKGQNLVQNQVQVQAQEKAQEKAEKAMRE